LIIVPSFTFPAAGTLCTFKWIEDDGSEGIYILRLLSDDFFVASYWSTEIEDCDWSKSGDWLYHDVVFYVTFFLEWNLPCVYQTVPCALIAYFRAVLFQACVRLTVARNLTVKFL
jgi:hypothetical protein